MTRILHAAVWIVAGLAALVLAVAIGVPAWVARKARRTRL
jgi:hypothetical protein